MHLQSQEINAPIPGKAQTLPASSHHQFVRAIDYVAAAFGERCLLRRATLADPAPEPGTPLAASCHCRLRSPANQSGELREQTARRHHTKSSAA